MIYRYLKDESELIRYVRVRHNVEVGACLSLGGGVVRDGARHVVIYDYRDLDGYQVDWAIGVYKADGQYTGELIERVNVSRAGFHNRNLAASMR